MLDKSVYHIFGEDCARCAKNARFSAKSPRASGLHVSLPASIGTRHRAAIGLSEETDAIVLVVSEETGALSVAYKGRLRRAQDEQRLRRFLAAVLYRGVPKEADSPMRRRFQTLRQYVKRSRPAAETAADVKDHAA